jgi:hypothetical protein
MSPTKSEETTPDCEEYGKGYDAQDWNCEECADSGSCKEKTEAKSGKKSKSAKAVIAKAKAKAKSAPKIKAQNPDKKKAKKGAKTKKRSKAVVAAPEEKAVTKAVMSKVNGYAKKIRALQKNAAEAYSTLVIEGGPLVKEANELLPRDKFTEWAREECGYDYAAAMRIIQLFDTFGKKPKLIKNLGSTKLNAVLPVKDPVKFLEEHKEEAESMPYRDFRKVVEEERKDSGDVIRKPDPQNEFVKTMKKMTNMADGNFKALKKLKTRKSIKFNASEQEAVLAHIEQIEEWIEDVKELMSNAKTVEEPAPAKKAPAKKKVVKKAKKKVVKKKRPAKK